jgi:AAA+ superfamily predicted ATPase
LHEVPHELSGDDFASLASRSSGLSGADIEEIVMKSKRNAAARDAAHISLEDFSNIVKSEESGRGVSRLKQARDDGPDSIGWAEESSDDDPVVGDQ